MLTPTDVVALFSSMGGSVYGAVRFQTWPNNFSFRMVLGLQTSMVFLISFACIDYMRGAPGAPQVVPGVEFTKHVMSTALPVVVYLIMLAVVTIGIFYAMVFVAVAKAYSFIKSPYFASILLVAYLLLGYHALTLPVVPVDMRLL